MTNKIYTPIFVALTLLASCKNTDTQEVVSETANAGKDAYIKNCSLCHGESGTGSLNGAAMLNSSKLAKDDIIQMIHKGKNAMPGGLIRDSVLVQEVADYVIGLRN
jgi:mono/diheme cytochrome c family protein